MKSLFLALLLLSLAPALPGQEAPPNPDPFIAPAAPRYSAEELKQLVGPIALYPDPLVGLILPGSTFPSDIVLAARFVETGDDLSLVDQKPWDVSVRALTRYPDVLKWMDENLDWTTQLGHAYLAQPTDVMDAIQALRTKAQEVGNLVDTPQQKIVREEQYIRIVPAEPDYVYAPYYDPGLVYYERAVDYPLLTFGPRWLTGWWLCFDFDWRRRHLYCGDWDGGWDYHHDHDRYDYYGDRVYINEHLTNYRVWEGDRDRRFASARSLADAGSRRALAKPERFRERPQLASKVERNLAKREERWAKRAVSSGLADRSVLDEKGRRGKEGRERAGTAQSEAPNLSDALVGKGRRDAEEKGRADGARGKDGKDRETLPKGEAPTPAPGSVAGTKADRGRGAAEAKGALEGRGAEGKGRIETPKRDAPSVADTKADKGRGAAEAKGALEGRGAEGKGRIETPKRDAPSVADTKADKGRGAAEAKGALEGRGAEGKGRIETPKRDAPSVAGAKADKGGPQPGPDIRGSSTGKGPTPSRGPEVKGRSSSGSSGQVAKQDARPSASKPKVTPAPRSASSVSQSPKSSPRSYAQRSEVRKSAPKPKPLASVSQSAPRKSRVAPPSVKKSAPRPKVAAAKPQASPKRSKPSIAKSSPRPKVSAPQRTTKVVKKASPSRPSAKGGGAKGGGAKGGGGTKKKKK